MAEMPLSHYFQKQKIVYIARELGNQSALCSELEESRLLQDKDVEELAKLDPIPFVTQLLKLIGNDVNKLRELRTILIEIGWQKASDLLQDWIGDNHHHQEIDLEALEKLSIDSFPHTEKGAGDQQKRVLPTDKPKIDAKKYYPMTNCPRGHCLIINNSVFINGTMDTRYGSEHDVERLQQLFNDLYFDVSVAWDLTRDEIRQTLNQYTTYNRQKDAQCFFLIIMTHGNSGVIYGIDSESLTIAEVCEMFNNENCPALKNVPKVFLFQACRGDKPDGGTPGPRGSDTGPFRDIPDAKPGIERVNNFSSYRLPIWTDMLIAYSTQSNYVSNKNPILGSWFMAALFSVFCENAHKQDLQTLLNRVAKRMHRMSSHDGGKQSPEICYRGWTSKLYFNPGYCGPPPSPIGSSSST